MVTKLQYLRAKEIVKRYEEINSVIEKIERDTNNVDLMRSELSVRAKHGLRQSYYNVKGIYIDEIYPY